MGRGVSVSWLSPEVGVASAAWGAWGARASPHVLGAGGLTVRSGLTAELVQPSSSPVVTHDKSDREIEAKFQKLSQEWLTSQQIDTLLDRLWHLEQVVDVGEVIRLVRI